jgi:signal transduction histidine kinase
LGITLLSSVGVLDPPGRGVMRTPKPFRFRSLTARSWSIRAKIISLLLVPLIALIAMWGLATFVTLSPGLDLLKGQDNLTNIATPAGNLLAELQAERKLSVTYLAATRRDATALNAQRTRTDVALEAFRQLAGPDTYATELTLSRKNDLLTKLQSLPKLRDTVDRAEVDRLGALQRYTDLTEPIFQIYASMAVSANNDLAAQSRALVALSRGREQLAQEDSLISGAVAAGTVSSAELGQIVQIIGAQRYIFAQTLPDLVPADRDGFTTMSGGASFIQLSGLENRIISDGRAGAALPIEFRAWTSSYGDVTAQLRAFELRTADGLVERSKPPAEAIFLRLGIAGLLGLITVILTIVATFRVGRSLIKRLAGLRQAALEMSIDRLPRVVARLRLGEEVDVAHEAPPLPYGDDEIGQVGHAFNELQRTAVNAAVDEASVRRGLNEVFLNIARRSQTLLHRQLSILDRMERRADDPTELEDLFRIDHLATRMRRHAEDLVILAGAAPGRGWRNPVPIVDVLRGSVSEVEDYARISIRPMPEVAVVGRAVGDLIHLLAELLENATSFSPPHTRVNVGGELVSHGFAIEIEDRGLGMTAAAIAEVNHRLADPPEFDPANSAQLGLFVVARLANRHGIRVQLRSSPYGGVTAVALVPQELIVAHSTERPALPRAREVVAALPSAPHLTRTDSTVDGARYDGRLDSADTSHSGTRYEATTYQGNGVGRYPDYDDARETIVLPPVIVTPTSQTPNGYAPGSSTDTVTPANVVTPSEVVTPEADKLARRSRKAGKTVPRHARQEIIEAPLADGGDSLPRRVRQTSLAPQLRDLPPETTNDFTTESAPARSADEIREMMTSFQSGMNRGRRDAELATDEVIGGDSERDTP